MMPLNGSHQYPDCVTALQDSPPLYNLSYENGREIKAGGVRLRCRCCLQRSSMVKDPMSSQSLSQYCPEMKLPGTEIHGCRPRRFPIWPDLRYGSSCQTLSFCAQQLQFCARGVYICRETKPYVIHCHMSFIVSTYHKTLTPTHTCMHDPHVNVRLRPIEISQNMEPSPSEVGTQWTPGELPSRVVALGKPRVATTPRRQHAVARVVPNHLTTEMAIQW